MSPLTRRRLLLRGGIFLAILGTFGVRKYLRHYARLPRMTMDPATLAAAKTVNVTIYSAEWCHSCRDAEQFLHENGIPYEAHDIEKDPAAAARAEALNPRHTIPVIDVEGTILTGYEPHDLEAALATAAQRHLAGGNGSPHS